MQLGAVLSCFCPHHQSLLDTQIMLGHPMAAMDCGGPEAKLLPLSGCPERVCEREYYAARRRRCDIGRCSARTREIAIPLLLRPDLMSVLSRFPGSQAFAEMGNRRGCRQCAAHLKRDILSAREGNEAARARVVDKGACLGVSLKIPSLAVCEPAPTAEGAAAASSEPPDSVSYDLRRPQQVRERNSTQRRLPRC